PSQMQHLASQPSATLAPGSSLQLNIIKTDIPPHLDAELGPLPLNLTRSSPASSASPGLLASPSPGSAVLKGVVIGMEKSGETVIHTDIGTMKVHLTKPLPQSTDITFALLSISSPDIAETPAFP